MPDPFVVLAALLLLPILALLGFIGCAALLGLDDVTYSVAAKVDLNPPEVTLGPAQRQQFQATPNWNANALVRWSHFGPGSLTPQGEYVAPAVIAAPTSATIMAAADNNGAEVTGNAKVTLIPVTVTLTPADVTLQPGCAATFRQDVKGTPNQAVDWSPNAPNGLYRAPSPFNPARRSDTVRATSQEPSKAFGEARVTLVPPTPNLRVNCGGVLVRDAPANWDADRGFSGATRTATAAVPGAFDVYETCRLGRDFTYRFTGFAPGVFFVLLKFAELEQRTQPRAFNFSIANGAGVLLTAAVTNFDVSRAANGPFKPADRAFRVTVDATATIVIHFTGAGVDAFVNAIEIAQSVCT